MMLINTILVSCLLTADPHPEKAVRSRLPGCGVCATFAAVRCAGLDLSLAETINAFSPNQAQTDVGVVSMLDITQALGKLDVPCRPIHMPTADIQFLDAPAILFFRSGRWGNSKSQYGPLSTFKGRDGTVGKSFELPAFSKLIHRVFLPLPLV